MSSAGSPRSLLQYASARKLRPEYGTSNLEMSGSAQRQDDAAKVGCVAC